MTAASVCKIFASLNVKDRSVVDFGAGDGRCPKSDTPSTEFSSMAVRTQGAARCAACRREQRQGLRAPHQPCTRARFRMRPRAPQVSLGLRQRLRCTLVRVRARHMHKHVPCSAAQCRAVRRGGVRACVCVCVWRGRGVSGRAAHHNEHTGLLKTSTASMISHPTSNASTHFVRTHGTHGTHGRKCLLLLYTSAPFDGFDVPISEEFGRVTAMCRGWHAGGHTGENSDAVLALIRALARCVRRANSIVDALLQPSHCHWCREP